MALFESNEMKQRKLNQIALQNIVLNINEKKMQVSDEFLEKMTKIYISKYLKVINEHSADLGKLSNIGLLFKKYDIIMSNLDELLKIEPLYRFNKPAPSEYKAQLEGSMDEFVNSLITREWKKIKPMSGTNRIDPMTEKKCTQFFDNFDLYYDRLPAISKKLLEQLRESVFPQKSEPDPIPALNDEFVPAEFEHITLDDEQSSPESEADTPENNDETQQ